MSRKLSYLTLKRKAELIKEVEDGIKKKKDIAKEYGIPPSTLSTIMKNRQAILEAWNESPSNSRKRSSAVRYPEVDEAMVLWMTQVRAAHVALSGPLLLEKAAYFAEAFGYADFQASVGWLDKFKLRHQVVYKKICGESATVSDTDCDNWRETVLAGLLEEYTEENVFSADETALFYKCMPDRTLTFRGDTCHTGQHSKERVTIMIGSNMSGTEQLPILLIGKSRNPRCFKGVKKLPVTYKNNPKSWMTSKLYENWLKELDAKFEATKRKILLLLDNCPAHPKVLSFELKAVRVVFFPPKMTSKLQPMDCGVIKVLKEKYRKKLIQKLILHVEKDAPKEPFSISLLDCCNMISSAWRDIGKDTIHNCFQTAFGLACSSEATSDSQPDTNVAWDYVREHLHLDNILTFETYNNVDSSVAVAEPLTDSGIVVMLKNANATDPDDEEESVDEGETVQPPTAKEALEMCSRLRQYVSSRDSAPSKLFCGISDIENFAESDFIASKKQKNILDFFRPK